MNKTYVRIKQAQKQYRLAAIREKNHRAKVKASVLSTLLGDIETRQKRGEEVTEGAIVSMIKKFISNINEALRERADADLESEKEALTVLLPKQLTSQELRKLIKQRVGKLDNPSPKDMKVVMEFLKKDHGGCYNGKEASDIAKEMLNQE